MLIERIADAVVRKIQEQQQIDAVARAVIAYMSRQGQFATAGPSPVGVMGGETHAGTFEVSLPAGDADAPEVAGVAAPPATDRGSPPEEQGGG